MRHEATNNRKFIAIVLSVFLLAFTSAVQAQQPIVPRIGLLGGASGAANAGRIEAFRQGLRELGYTDGKNIVIEERWAEGKLDRVPA